MTISINSIKDKQERKPKFYCGETFLIDKKIFLVISFPLESVKIKPTQKFSGFFAVCLNDGCFYIFEIKDEQLYYLDIEDRRLIPSKYIKIASIEAADVSCTVQKV